MSYHCKIILQYEGTRYDGWQKQGNTSNTIQGKLEQVLERMAGEPVEVRGSGRTDAGVHAAGQVADFWLPELWREKGAGFVKDYLNRYLPEDMAVLEASEAPERFHSRLQAARKLYLYRIETGSRRDVFSRRLQYGLGRPLDTEAMAMAAELLTGTHDFKSFCGNKRMKKSTVRTVYRISVRQEPDSSLVTLEFEGNGFLQNMVRIMAGTLMETGLGTRDWRSMPDILAAGDRQAAGFMAPAEGLCLEWVLYDEP
ncbi:MAG: tRNA pseudouridine(38-40) synthase TruA [Eubacteriales bacterium]|nr:tRNA pseudouridine(38-40) synthase TruA [Eubacteriales bacterium]